MPPDAGSLSSGTQSGGGTPARDSAPEGMEAAPEAGPPKTGRGGGPAGGAVAPQPTPSGGWPEGVDVEPSTEEGEEAEVEAEEEEEEDPRILHPRPARRRRIAAPEVGSVSPKGGLAGRAPAELEVVVVSESEVEGEDAEEGLEEEEGEDIMDVTVPPKMADRALALLLCCHRPGSRAATARRSRALSLL